MRPACLAALRTTVMQAAPITAAIRPCAALERRDSDELRSMAFEQAAPVPDDGSGAGGRCLAVRRIARVEGVVQGVGFRPFVARLAASEGLAGFVRNEGAFVRIDVEGRAEALDALAERLRAEAPPAARIDRVSWDEASPLGRDAFVIEESASD